MRNFNFKSFILVAAIIICAAYTDLSWAPPGPPVPAPGTPEIPGALSGLIALIAVGGAYYWKSGKNKKDDNDKR